MEDYMRRKILWVEDGAFIEVSSFTGPLFTSAKYDLDVALNVTDAIRKIKETEFDAVIVDIRIPPGLDRAWENLYSESGYNKIGARLGIQLLFSLLKPGMSEVKLENIPSWVSPEKFGVFSVESVEEVKKELKQLDISLNHFQQKITTMPKTALLELIEKVITNTHLVSSIGGK